MSLVKIFTRSRRDLAEISARIAARSRRVFGRRDFPIAEITAEIAARSRRDTGNLGGQKLAAISPRFSPRCGKSRRPKTRRDLAAILAEMREISAAKNAPRSRRDSRRDHSEIWKSRRANTRRDVAARSRRDTEISAAKTRRDCEVISRRDMDISAGSFAARSRWESCRAGFAARNEIPGGQNLTVIPSRSEILGSQIRFDENDIYIYVNN